MSPDTFRIPVRYTWRGALILVAVTAALGGTRVATPAASKSLLAPAQQGASPAKPRGGYVLERDAEVAREEPGTHKGGGQTIGYSFFKDTPNLGMVFRKRALKPGSAIGYHEQKEDEIYYVLSGRGLMTIDGKDDRGRPRHRGPHAARQLARPEAGRHGRPRHHDQLPPAGRPLTGTRVIRGAVCEMTDQPWRARKTRVKSSAG